MFEIKENYKLEELKQIFDENNQNFVFDKDSITDDTYIKYVCTENDIPLGYLVLYPHSDFAEYDDYDINVDIPKNSIYIWHIVTKKGYERHGVARSLIDYLKRKYSKYNIYSIVDQNNDNSNKLHKALGFEKVETFKKAYKETLDTYTLVRFKPSV